MIRVFHAARGKKSADKYHGGKKKPLYDCFFHNKNFLSSVNLFKGQNAISFIAIIWGITGLRKGVKGFNIALYNKVNNKQYIGKLVYAIIETALSILLVFDPFEKVEEHLVILGFEMIIIALKVAFYDEKEYEEIDY